MKVVREHYLRDDVWCGVEGCVVCRQGDSATLNAFSIVQSDLCPQPHFILPDTNVILHQIDFLEDPVIKNVIVLQVVLQEVSVFDHYQGLSGGDHSFPPRTVACSGGCCGCSSTP